MVSQATMFCDGTVQAPEQKQTNKNKKVQTKCGESRLGRHIPRGM